jgi:protein-tyrosine phosphatase
MTEGEARFTVLTVCTGNICRSPAAERLIRHDWADGASTIEVVSGGTRAMVGEPIQISMAHLLEQSGAYSGEFCAQTLTAELVDDADLVLGMTRRHRAAAVALAPAATSHTFTLREFTRLVVDGVEDFRPSPERADSLRRLVEVAASRRAPITDPELDDIADPYGQDLDAYHVAFSQISAAVDTVGRVLSGSPLPESDSGVGSSDTHAEPAPQRRRAWGRRA